MVYSIARAVAGPSLIRVAIGGPLSGQLRDAVSLARRLAVVRGVSM